MPQTFTLHTPWGHADHYENLGQGVFQVSTPSHGGIFVPECMLHCIGDEGRAYAKKWSGSEQWYEEDCAWAYVAVNLTDRFSPAQVAQAHKTLAWINKN